AAAPGWSVSSSRTTNRSPTGPVSGGEYASEPASINVGVESHPTSAIAIAVRAQRARWGMVVMTEVLAMVRPSIRSRAAIVPRRSDQLQTIAVLRGVCRRASRAAAARGTEELLSLAYSAGVLRRLIGPHVRDRRA